MDKKIETLRMFFRVSNAGFEFANAITGNKTPNNMQQLHKLALEEIEKENPDMAIIDKLLAEMQETAEVNSQPKPNFPKGGI